MVAVPVVITAEDFLFEKLRAALPIQVPVHSGFAPENTPYPLCLYAYLDGEDIPAAASQMRRVMTRADYVVRITDHTESFRSILTLTQAADAALQGASGASEEGGSVLSCQRVEPFVQRETDPAGVTYLSLGGVYRMYLKEA